MADSPYNLSLIIHASVHSLHRLFCWVICNMQSIPGDRKHNVWYTLYGIDRMPVYCTALGFIIHLRKSKYSTMRKSFGEISCIVVFFYIKREKRETCEEMTVCS